MKRALICGVSGQDGAYLAELLLTKLQIVELNAKDAHDIFHLLSGLRVGRDSARPSFASRSKQASIACQGSPTSVPG